MKYCDQAWTMPSLLLHGYSTRCHLTSPWRKRHKFSAHQFNGVDQISSWGWTNSLCIDFLQFDCNGWFHLAWKGLLVQIGQTVRQAGNWSICGTGWLTWLLIQPCSFESFLTLEGCRTTSASWGSMPFRSQLLLGPFSSWGRRAFEKESKMRETEKPKKQNGGKND